MRTIILAVLTVAGIALVGTTSGPAAPVAGTAIGQAASEAAPYTQVQGRRYWRCVRRCEEEGGGRRYCRRVCDRDWWD
jgi:hypothetical protein